MIGRLACASFILAGLAGCDSLTTPESNTTELVIVVGPVTGGVNDTLLTTGDTIQYAAIAFLLPDSVIALVRSENWGASDSVLRRITPSDQGRFVARRLGRDTVRVRAVVKTDFGDVTVVGQKAVRVTTERFFGTFTPTTVAFRDLIIIKPPAGGEQPFTDSTQILFAPDPAASALLFIPGIPIVRNADSLVAVVPAGFATGSVALTSIAPNDRDLAARQPITRASGDNDLDPFDRADSTRVGLPFVDVLSVHDPADVDVYEFTLTAPMTLTIDLLWNVASDLDFVVDTFSILGQRGEFFRGSLTDTSREGPHTRAFPARRYEMTVSAKTYIGPTTYVMTILSPP